MVIITFMDQKANMNDFPFTEEQMDDSVVRTFSSEVDEHELQWHVDEEDRTVVPLNKNNWMFQRDNCLPEPIDKEIRIAKNEWHRVIKGDGNLIVKIMRKK